ncbi:hypothetical protein [Rhodoluna limnophila]|uniref:hypothetical protein n=1 Tax=Rhodoluna limnophila TaxID=232537 RepID=UPI001105DDC0|nr:hypothetical protein [Rhodoluna limnophila]
MHPEARRLQEMLQSLYARHRGLVGFIDESYRSNRDEEFPFYTVTATILDVEDLIDFRDDYFSIVGGHRWHTTEMYKNGETEKIKDFIAVLANHESELVVSVQVEIEDDDLEHARRECLVQIVSRLSSMGCNLVVYERREDNKTRNADAALFSRASRDGLIPRNLRVFPGSPSAEKLLWGPDLAGWAMRRYVAMDEIDWVRPFINNCEVIDASLGMKLKKKGPQPAAAMGSGPDSSVGLKGEGKNRSSSKSIARFGAAEKTIFEIFPKISDPAHDPGLLGDWLLREFPRRK